MFRWSVAFVRRGGLRSTWAYLASSTVPRNWSRRSASVAEEVGRTVAVGDEHPGKILRFDCDSRDALGPEYGGPDSTTASSSGHVLSAS